MPWRKTSRKPPINYIVVVRTRDRSTKNKNELSGVAMRTSARAHTHGPSNHVARSRSCGDIILLEGIKIWHQRWGTSSLYMCPVAEPRLRCKVDNTITPITHPSPVFPDQWVTDNGLPSSQIPAVCTSDLFPRFQDGLHITSIEPIRRHSSTTPTTHYPLGWWMQ